MLAPELMDRKQQEGGETEEDQIINLCFCLNLCLYSADVQNGISIT